MNLSPTWVQAFGESELEAVHWSDIGPPDASDSQIMEYARAHGFIVFTLDLDFAAILAYTRAGGPSVVQLRTQDVLPEAVGDRLIRALMQFDGELERGALLTIDVLKNRARLLPLSD